MTRKKEKAIDTTRILIIIVIVLIFLMLAVLGKMALDMINGAKNAKNETAATLPSASVPLPEGSSDPIETPEPAASSLEPDVTESESPSEIPTEETTEPPTETTPRTLARGRRRPVEIPGSEFELHVDTVVIAIGTSPNPLIKSTTKGLEVNRKGGIIIDEAGLTSRRGVYAGGDAVTGAATVISAMGAGKTAARSIDDFLRSKEDF